jgi:hypothetical protein
MFDLLRFAATGEVVNELPIPAIAYGLISLAIFVAITLVFFSFRDVANRHSEKAEQYARDNEEKSH